MILTTSKAIPSAARTFSVSTLADSDFSELEAKLTAKGIRLVNGAETDPCIDL